MGHQEHKARSTKSVGCRVVTISDTRTPETDESGSLIQKLLRERGHRIEGYELIRDEPSRIQDVIRAAAECPEVQAVILTGGTGLSIRDSTPETVLALLDRKLEGFGELFRSLSYEEIGSAAMISRAVAGTFRGRVIFSLPGSAAAVRLGMEKLILPELGHIVGELGR